MNQPQPERIDTMPTVAKPRYRIWVVKDGNRHYHGAYSKALYASAGCEDFESASADKRQVRRRVQIACHAARSESRKQVVGLSDGRRLEIEFGWD